MLGSLSLSYDDLLQKELRTLSAQCGVWYRILNSVGKISVITNALIIAFTSSFIEETFYKVFISPDGSLNGFLNFTLSDFNIGDFPGDLNILSEPDTSVEYCNVLYLSSHLGFVG
ncbi:anoctamin-1-like isoform X2 [Tachypleus tridentatus]|uniref:anoctamin-1-like isoform X2 n=1 Tax=Tachypleus tridentatus TaxID=6853 RepID=UPI003FD5D772